MQWQTADAPSIVNDATSELHIAQAATNELRPLDLSSEPALAELLQAVDLAELAVPAEKDKFDVILTMAGNRRSGSSRRSSA
jgi:hypothetical protein